MKGILYHKLSLTTLSPKRPKKNKNREMFKFVLVATLLACVVAAPVEDEAHAEVKELKSEVRADGFDFSLDTSNNIHEQASGDAHGNVQGGFEWDSPEGVHVKVAYVADEQGYHPTGDLLPTPPPVPVAILKALEFINAHPQKKEEAKH
uniref:Larval cuticle protein 2 n=1 Tax=Glossina brevipalpis TaxID=37001 RepID=A0A1A9W8X9_9MUSC